MLLKSPFIHTVLIDRPDEAKPHRHTTLLFIFLVSFKRFFFSIYRLCSPVALVNIHHTISTMFSINPFDLPHFYLPQPLSVCYFLLILYFSLSLSPSPVLESTFTQFNCDTRTISFMADHASVFSIRSGSCTLFIWGNHNSHGPAETNGKSLRFCFPGEVLERTIP